jgi:CBS domain containing-hemolysin-like protein
MYSLLITFFVLAILFSFLCSLWEAVLLSITPAYARIQHRQGTTIGRYLYEFKENIDRPLAAILTLNTIAHTVGAIGVGEQAATIWSESNPLITRIVVPAVMTIAVLLLSEIVPKTIGALYWQRLSGFTVYSLRFLMVALAPLVWMGQLVTRSLKHGSEQAVLTRHDFLTMAELGAQDGVFEDRETEMIGNLLGFNEILVRDIMTPRSVVTATPEDQTIGSYYERLKEHPFSRIPTYKEGSKDKVNGYILKVDLLQAMIQDRREKPLSELRRDIVAVAESVAVTDLFVLLMEKREHIAVVLDDFGGIAGIVTMEDVIETLLGMEIVDETDTTIDMRVLAQRLRERRATALDALEANNGDDGEAAHQDQ